MPSRGKCHSCECCQNCRYRLSLKRFDYTKGSCEHTEMDGFICTIFSDEGVAVWMVGVEECEEQCECWERNVRHEAQNGEKAHSPQRDLVCKVQNTKGVSEPERTG